jgi:N-acetylneuraminate synthase
MTNHTIVIAEAGVNHNGSMDLALKLVDAAADAGADYVKFQTFKADKLATGHAPKAEYQKNTTDAAESQLEMLRKLELSIDDHRQLMAHCARRKIRFMSSPFDLDSLDFLADDLKIDTIKIPSGEITNAAMLLHAARKNMPMIVSTGMASLADIELALGVIAFGFLSGGQAPGQTVFADAFADSRAKALLRERVTLLHCTTEYPAPLEDVHLRAMEVMRDTFGLRVGYSDHTPGLAVTVAAVAREATVIEKHLTLDRELPGPDHRASLEPKEFSDLVASVRAVERALGRVEKKCQPSEEKNKATARKGLYAAQDIAHGEVLSAEAITLQRPVKGRSAMDYWDVIGTKAQHAYKKGDAIH